MKEVSTAGKPLTAFHLKMAALITMVIDHTAAALTLPWGVDTLMRSIGRMAFPIYAFFIAEGCRYTRSRERYMLRLGLFGLISQFPFVLAFYGWAWEPGKWWYHLLIPGNVFYTMFLAVACIHIWETLRRRSRKVQLAAAGTFAGCFALWAYTLFFITGSPWPFIITILAYFVGFLTACHFLGRRAEEEKTPDWLANILAALPILPFFLLAEVLNFDYEGEGLALILILYLLKDRRMQMLALAGWIFLEYGWEGGLRLKYAGYNSQVLGWENILTVEAFLPLCFALAAVLLIWLYNGRRGKDVKWAFYASYPVHIAILAVLAALGL